jgi:hypothetical protein
MNNNGERVPLFGPAALRETVLGAFPDLASEIDSYDGIHMIMGRLDKAIMAAVRDADYPRARAVLTLLDGLLNRHDLDPEIQNAVSITIVPLAAPADLAAFAMVLRGARANVHSDSCGPRNKGLHQTSAASHRKGAYRRAPAWRGQAGGRQWVSV